MMLYNFFRFATIVIVAGIISACSGAGSSGTAASNTNSAADGSSSQGSSATSGSISGTAATGSPILGNIVAIDASGKTFSVSSGIDGSYSLDVTGGTAPFLLTLIGSSNGKTVNLTSVATAIGQTVNITPLTDLIVSTAAGVPGASALVAECVPTVTANCSAALTAATSSSNLSSATNAVASMIAPLNSTGLDPLTGVFAADGTGFDAMLEQILVEPAQSQGASATITLIAVPQQPLGTVVLPATAGSAAKATTVTPSVENLTVAAAASAALAQVQTCMASLAALYPANLTVAPASSDVSPFIASSFTSQGTNATQYIQKLSTLSTSGGLAQPNLFAKLNLTVSGLSDFNFTPSTTSGGVGSATAPVVLNGTTPTALWVRVGTSSNLEFVAGSAFPGCPGGWQLAGDQIPISMNMDSRANKYAQYSPARYEREMAVHLDTSSGLAKNVQYAVISGPGLAVYSGTPDAPVGAATQLVLEAPSSNQSPNYQIVDSGRNTFPYYGDLDAIQSCQDLATAISQVTQIAAPTGTPCYDATQVSPDTLNSSLYIWDLYDSSSNLISEFGFQIGAAPLSIAFVQANDEQLFPSGIVAPTLTNLNTIIASVAAGQPVPDNSISFTYTVPSTYAESMEVCGIILQDSGGSAVFVAEQSGGLTFSSCSLTSAGIDQGSLNTANPADTATGGYYYLTVNALGNTIQTFNLFAQ